MGEETLRELGRACGDGEGCLDEPLTGFNRREYKNNTTVGLSYLDNVLGEEFEGATAEELTGNQDDGSVASDGSFEEKVSGTMTEGVRKELMIQMSTLWPRLVEKRWFTGLFMLLTCYALFVPDVDMSFGSKESRLVLSIVTTGVVLLFSLEILLRSLVKSAYICGAFFWLDMICVISLIPETYLVELMVSNSAYAAGRSTRLTRILTLATKSSRAARLHRVLRIIRVAAFLPRLQRFFSYGVRIDDTEKLLDKKLQRIFHFLDEDMDGYVARSAVDKCAMKIRALNGPRAVQGNGWASKVVSRFSLSDSMRILTPETSPVSSPARKSCPPLPRLDRRGSFEFTEDSEQLTIADFRVLLLGDAAIRADLTRACRMQLRQGNNMRNVTARNTEHLGMKVALCVLLLLFLMSLMMQSTADLSGEFGLKSIDGLVRTYYLDQRAGSRIPLLVHEQVKSWAHGTADWGFKPRQILYLDLNKMVYCNSLVREFPHCPMSNSSDSFWSARSSLDDIDRDLRASSHRRVDMVLLRIPDFSEIDISAEDLERKTTAVAVLDGRSAVEHTARIGILTTCCVMLIILLGIAALSTDLNFLSNNLLKPLVELAEEMESISRLHLAGFSGAEDTGSAGGTSEIRLIRHTFENMKTAIKSWGKYVPWQVVQLLLRKDAEVNIEMKDSEVSVFFSDIANFTTIVENLPPERSLLLLSRYFCDMSSIIDDYGGIVLEFIGDAILGIYGAPVSNEDHPTNAVKSALRMVDRLSFINKWCTESSLPTVSIRCGVHTGRALVGNMGFQSRMKYGIIGEESEVPRHLEEMNKNYSTKLLISEATFSRLVPCVFITRPIDYVYFSEAQGGESHLVYQVLERSTASSHPNTHFAASLHAEAVVCYRMRKFDEAALKFQQVNGLMANLTGEEDVPSALLLKRCRHYAKQPPPPGWDGVWDRGMN